MVLPVATVGYSAANDPEGFGRGVQSTAKGVGELGNTVLNIGLIIGGIIVLLIFLIAMGIAFGFDSTVGGVICLMIAILVGGGMIAYGGYSRHVESKNKHSLGLAQMQQPLLQTSSNDGYQQPPPQNNMHSPPNKPLPQTPNDKNLAYQPRQIAATINPYGPQGYPPQPPPQNNMYSPPNRPLPPTPNDKNLNRINQGMNTVSAAQNLAYQLR